MTNADNENRVVSDVHSSSVSETHRQHREQTMTIVVSPNMSYESMGFRGTFCFSFLPNNVSTKVELSGLLAQTMPFLSARTIHRSIQD